MGVRFCDKHQRYDSREYDRKRPTSTGRGYGKHHRKRRALMMVRSPWCVQCKGRGHLVLGRERDHIIPLRDGGTDGPENEQLLCKTCHSRKTMREEHARRRRRKGNER
jgi:5-methylcytosine-specific restriction protein A